MELHREWRCRDLREEAGAVSLKVRRVAKPCALKRKDDMILRFVVLVSSVLSVFGCATTRHQAVDKRMILPQGAQQTELLQNQKFLMAAPIENPTPPFPVESIGTVDTTVCVEFVVMEDGSVSSARQIDTSFGCEPVGSAASKAFVPTVLRTVESWSFFGAAICSYRLSEAECDNGSAQLVPTAIKLAYKFQFSQSKGDRKVLAGALH